VLRSRPEKRKKRKKIDVSLVSFRRRGVKRKNRPGGPGVKRKGGRTETSILRKEAPRNKKERGVSNRRLGKLPGEKKKRGKTLLLFLKKGRERRKRGRGRSISTQGGKKAICSSRPSRREKGGKQGHDFEHKKLFSNLRGRGGGPVESKKYRCNVGWAKTKKQSARVLSALEEGRGGGGGNGRRGGGPVWTARGEGGVVQPPPSSSKKKGEEKKRKGD